GTAHPTVRIGDVVMLWEVEIRPIEREVDREGRNVLGEARRVGAASVTHVAAGRSYLVEGDLSREQIEGPVRRLLADEVVEQATVRQLPDRESPTSNGHQLLNVLVKPGVTDNIGLSATLALQNQGLPVDRVATCRKFWINSDAAE